MGESMQKRMLIRPINSLVYIHDASQFDVPELRSDTSITSTPKCVLLLTYPEVDGPTDVSFDLQPGDRPLLMLQHDAMLETPSRTVVMSTVDEQILLSVPVAEATTRVRIWLNQRFNPNEIVIGLG